MVSRSLFAPKLLCSSRSVLDILPALCSEASSLGLAYGRRFTGLDSRSLYEGELLALVGQHFWPYALLSFSHTPPSIRQATSEDDATYLPPSETADLEAVTVGVTLRWAETPFVTSSRTATQGAGSKDPPTRPSKYRVRVWDGQTVLQELASTPKLLSNNSSASVHPSLVQDSPEATIGSLPLDRQFKVTVEALNSAGEVTTALTLLLYTGSFHVAAGAQTTDGVSWCYSALQVRCPGGAERCVSPFWLCDGSTDCPDEQIDIISSSAILTSSDIFSVRVEAQHPLPGQLCLVSSLPQAADCNLLVNKTDSLPRSFKETCFKMRKFFTRSEPLYQDHSRHKTLPWPRMNLYMMWMGS
ncbi:Low-density lipoprotein (LDL) receptor class A repeat [Trinorchestia longiramus]|nr:Low-density lipoprotein (LDL) receptor class A repeat [Trinorchestia longiramus]